VNMQFTTFAEEVRIWALPIWIIAILVDHKSGVSSVSCSKNFLLLRYPMVSVSMNDEGTRMILHNQTRFLYLESSRMENTSNIWPIPLQIRSNIAKVPRLVWLLNRTGWKWIKIIL
jgi:hypothetical protein